MFSIDFFFTPIIVAEFVPINLGWFTNLQKSNRLIAKCSFCFIFCRPKCLGTLILGWFTNLKRRLLSCVLRCGAWLRTRSGRLRSISLNEAPLPTIPPFTVWSRMRQEHAVGAKMAAPQGRNNCNNVPKSSLGSIASNH